jgi:hypothetical protein
VEAVLDFIKALRFGAATGDGGGSPIAFYGDGAHHRIVSAKRGGCQGGKAEEEIGETRALQQQILELFRARLFRARRSA